MGERRYGILSYFISIAIPPSFPLGGGCAAGPVAAVPFPALLDPRDVFLVERHPITTAPSLRALVTMLARPRLEG